MTAETYLLLVAPVLLVTGVSAVLMITEAFDRRRHAELRAQTVRARSVSRG